MWYINRQITQKNSKDYDQKKVHTAFEKSEFDPAFAYAAIVNYILTCIFFQPILPLGAASALVGLVLTYYAYKKMLLRDSKRPVMVSDDIAEVTLYLLNAAPFVYGVATLNPALLGHLRQNAARQGRDSVHCHVGTGYHQYILPLLPIVLKYF